MKKYLYVVFKSFSVSFKPEITVYLIKAFLAVILKYIQYV